MPKRQILPIEDLSEDTQKFLEILTKETDVAVILVGASYIDAYLASILQRKLIKSSISDRLLDSRNGALGTFSIRSDACYALGLIEKPLYQDLIKIAEIRNEIAHHHLTLDFDSSSIQKLCAELSYINSIPAFSNQATPQLSKVLQGARYRFVITAVMVTQKLLNIGRSLRNERSE